MNSRLKEIRLKLGLSQKKFGDKMFLSQDQISLLENGKRKKQGKIGNLKNSPGVIF